MTAPPLREASISNEYIYIRIEYFYLNDALLAFATDSQSYGSCDLALIALWFLVKVKKELNYIHLKQSSSVVSHPNPHVSGPIMGYPNS